jgi:hypothetical protein
MVLFCYGANMACGFWRGRLVHNLVIWCQRAGTSLLHPPALSRRETRPRPTRPRSYTPPPLLGETLGLGCPSPAQPSRSRVATRARTGRAGLCLRHGPLWRLHENQGWKRAPQYRRPRRGVHVIFQKTQGECAEVQMHAFWVGGPRTPEWLPRAVVAPFHTSTVPQAPDPWIPAQLRIGRLPTAFGGWVAIPLGHVQGKHARPPTNVWGPGQSNTEKYAV